MNIHEYQAKELLRKEGVPIPPGEVAKSAAEAESIARKFGGTVVVKAQVHAGGRGKAGGVKLAKSPEETREIAGEDPRHADQGTHGRAGARDSGRRHRDRSVRRHHPRPRDEEAGVHGEPGGRHRHRGGRGQTPDKILKLPIDTRYGLQPYQASRLGFFLYDDVKQVRAAGKILQQLYAAFMKNGCSLAEINPLVTTPKGDVVALDAKMVIDDNELDRHPEIAALRDESAEAPSEVQARNANLTFIKLDGNVGCVVNGAGLAMATMDLVKYYGGDPANFLDIGGSSNPEKVVNALKIITEDPNVKAILFNIFGGITRTDDVANGIVTATKQNPLKVPIVIRLTGTNEEIAMKILQENGFSASSDMDEAVKKTVALAKGGKAA